MPKLEQTLLEKKQKEMQLLLKLHLEQAQETPVVLKGQVQTKHKDLLKATGLVVFMETGEA